MGRPESQLSGTDPRLVAFASDLRCLRKQAGSPSYRQLAREAHYSPSALSQAANGRFMPSLGVTLGFVQACGGDVAEWEHRWRTLDNDRLARGEHADDPLICWDLPEELTRDLISSSPGRPRHGMSQRLSFLALAAVVVCAGTITGLVIRSSGKNGPPATAQMGRSGRLAVADPIADGSDPNRAGCGPGAVTIVATRVHFPAAQLSGEVELRNSPRCRAAWGRFEPADGWKPGPGTMVTVWTIRPADQATQSYTVEYGGEAIIGNMLMTARGCVAAELTVARGTVQSPVATTECLVIH